MKIAPFLRPLATAAVPAVLAAALGLAATGTALAQAAWPAKPVRLVMPFSPGGPGDINARTFADALQRTLSQTMIVDNRPGAGGVIGSDLVAKAPPDGYTFLLAGNGAVTLPLLRAKMPYAESDLVPVARTHTTPSVLVVNAALGVRSLKDLQALARRNDASGKSGITFADAGSGSTGHFVAEMVQDALAIGVAIVHYKSGSETVNAVLSNQVDVASEASLAVLPHIRSGKLVPIAVASDRRLPMLPDVPTAAEQGFASVQMQHWGGYFAPKGTPVAILDKMNAAINATARIPEVRAKQESVGYESMTGTRIDFERFLVAEKQRLQKIVLHSKMSID